MVCLNLNAILLKSYLIPLKYNNIWKCIFTLIPREKCNNVYHNKSTIFRLEANK